MIKIWHRRPYNKAFQLEKINKKGNDILSPTNVSCNIENPENEDRTALSALSSYDPG